jgi:hypothetical protein
MMPSVHGEAAKRFEAIVSEPVGPAYPEQASERGDETAGLT